VATIKTRGGLVLTKGGRVSCSCCEAGCCMYPAAAVESGLITFEDLPDEILTPNGFSLPKVGPLDASGLTGIPYLVYYGQLEQGVGIATGEGLWSNQTDFSGGGGNTVESSCLFDGRFPKPTSSDWYVDNFEDSYTGQLFGGTEQIATSDPFTLFRVALCVWEGTIVFSNGFTQLARLEYFGPPPNVVTSFVGWIYNGIGTKGTSPAGGETTQNRPEGRYQTEDGDITVEITRSE